MNSIKNYVRELRLEKKLTQEELAKLCMVSRKTINVLENQSYVPSTLLALRLSKALGVSVEKLFQLE